MYKFGLNLSRNYSSISPTRIFPHFFPFSRGIILKILKEKLWFFEFNWDIENAYTLVYKFGFNLLNYFARVITTYSYFLRVKVRVMVFNATFNNISDILWWSVLLVEETGVSRENHRPAASHWQTFITLCCIEYMCTSPELQTHELNHVLKSFIFHI